MNDMRNAWSFISLTVISVGFLIAGAIVGIDWLARAESGGFFDKQSEFDTAFSRSLIYEGLIFPALLWLLGALCGITAIVINLWDKATILNKSAAYQLYQHQQYKGEQL